MLVGVNNYAGTGLSRSSHTVHDMEVLREELEKSGFEVEAALLDQEATKANIDAALKRLKARRKVGDVVLIAMSGHGVQTRNQAARRTRFLPCGLRAERDGHDGEPDGDAARAGQQGCEPGPGRCLPRRPAQGAKGIQGNELKDRLPANTAVLFSCSAGQSSFETNRMNARNATVGHGVFFYHVLQALDGNAKNRGG